jgi:hypothetical protein
VRRIFEETLATRNPNQNSRTIFSSNKSAPANRKNYTNRVPKKQEVVGGFSCLKRFKTLDSRSKLKNQKPIAVDVLFKGTVS